MTRVEITVDPGDNYITAFLVELKRKMEKDLNTEALINTINKNNMSIDYRLLVGLLNNDDITHSVKVTALMNDVIVVEYCTYKYAFEYIKEMADKCGADLELILRHLALELGTVVQKRCDELNFGMKCIVSLIPELDNKGKVYNKKYVYNRDGGTTVITVDNIHNEFTTYFLEAIYNEEEDDL